MIIYEIKINKYRYIGSTKNKSKRKYTHLKLLKNNKHFNKFMQNVYNKHNEYEFIVLKFCKNKIEMQKTEEKYIKIYKKIYGDLCVNVLCKYGGGSEWRKYKSKDELKIHDYKRTRLSPEARIKRNKTHSETIKNIPADERKDWYARGAKKRADNIKFRKNYTPINLKITFLDGTIEYQNYDTENLFFKGTNLEETSLRELKKNGKKIIKKRLHWTRHNFPIGTILEKI